MYNNAIGKMYRPIRFLNLKDKHGLEVTNKYKSNYGDIFKFDAKLFMEQSGVKIDFFNLKIPVIYSGHITEREPIPQDSNQMAIVRPINISSKDSLVVEFPIVVNSDDYDLLEIEMFPILVNTDALKEQYNLQSSDTDEALLVTIKTKKTKVMVSSDSGAVAL